MSAYVLHSFCLHTSQVFNSIKTSWADDVADELGTKSPNPSIDQPSNQSTETPQKISDSIDENGVRTVVEYVLNDEGKKVKVRLAGIQRDGA